MKKFLLLFLILVLASASPLPGKRLASRDFKQSLSNLQHEADSLNSTVKKYNEKN